MDTKNKAKKSKGSSAKSQMKDLNVRKEQANKVQGGVATFGPEALP